MEEVSNKPIIKAEEMEAVEEAEAVVEVEADEVVAVHQQMPLLQPISQISIQVITMIMTGKACHMINATRYLKLGGQKEMSAQLAQW